MHLTFTTVCKLPISQFQLRIFISIQPIHEVAINISYYFTVYANILFKTYLLHKLPSNCKLLQPSHVGNTKNEIVTNINRSQFERQINYKR